VLLLAFHFIPVAAGSWYAFTDWNGIGHAHFVGLQNFRELFSNPVTRGALRLIVVNVFGLVLALALNRTLKSRNLLRAVFFAPVVLSPLAVAFTWQYIFNFTGALNEFLKSVGEGSWTRAWLADPNWALIAILIVLVWQYTGLTMVIYLAGLQGIPDELIEASAVDGATMWIRFRRLILPLLAPAATINLTLTLVLSMRLFDQVIALTDGGPVNATETLATQVWRQTFVDGHYGYGSANALVLTALISVLALSQLVVMRLRERRI
jgi:raffinose/stachyose/melibiose transport system permease protein